MNKRHIQLDQLVEWFGKLEVENLSSKTVAEIIREWQPKYDANCENCQGTGIDDWGRISRECHCRKLSKRTSE